MNTFKGCWNDYRVEKPKTVDGISALMLVACSDGRVITAVYVSARDMWFSHESREYFGDVVAWWDFPVPTGFKLSPIYEEVDE